jgi:alanyl-tRNA synthetase
MHGIFQLAERREEERMNTETIKLFYEDPYQRTFFARVLSCEPKDGGYSVLLDRTAFYPEGGGQPSDTGVLNFANVTEVREKGGEIYHRTDRELPVGALVAGGINWPLRFARMQQHTGEHIVSGIAHRFFGVDNVGFHMGDSFLTVDWSGELTADQLALIETLANEAVYRNVSVAAEYPPPEVLSGLDYRSKKELTGAVRIVTVPGYDVCACCGTHVSHTGEIGAVKILTSQRYKGGTRITMTCGSQAMADYGERLRRTQEISALLSAKPEEISDYVKQTLNEMTLLKRRISDLQEKMLELQIGSAPEHCGKVCRFFEDLPPELLRKAVLKLAERCGTAVAFSGEGDSYRYAAADPSGDVRPIGKELNQKLNGRGGGPKELVQGSLRADREEIRKALDGWIFLN